MSTETKWADVAHYYLQSPIVLTDNKGTEYDRGVAVSYGKFYRLTPILGHYEDMTEDEDNECMLVHTRWVEDEDLRRVIWSLAKQHKTFDQYSTHWLISHGFDVFGLIERGEAIRKEVSNAS